MKNIIASFAILATAVLFTLPFSAGAAAQSQGASTERSKAASKRAKVRVQHQYADTRCHTYGGYGWGPYWGPCPYRGQIFAERPGPPVFGPFLPFGPFW